MRHRKDHRKLGRTPSHRKAMLRNMVTSLLAFNIGVELGQLSFVGAVLGTAALWQRTRIQVPDWAWRVPAYGIGAVAAFWMIQRTVAFWP